MRLHPILGHPHPHVPQLVVTSTRTYTHAQVLVVEVTRHLKNEKTGFRNLTLTALYTPSTQPTMPIVNIPDGETLAKIVTESMVTANYKRDEVTLGDDEVALLQNHLEELLGGYLASTSVEDLLRPILSGGSSQLKKTTNKGNGKAKVQTMSDDPNETFETMLQDSEKVPKLRAFYKKHLLDLERLQAIEDSALSGHQQKLLHEAIEFYEKLVEYKELEPDQQVKHFLELHNEQFVTETNKKGEFVRYTTKLTLPELLVAFEIFGWAQPDSKKKQDFVDTMVEILGDTEVNEPVKGSPVGQKSNSPQLPKTVPGKYFAQIEGSPKLFVLDMDKPEVQKFMQNFMAGIESPETLVFGAVGRSMKILGRYDGDNVVEMSNKDYDALLNRNFNAFQEKFGAKKSDTAPTQEQIDAFLKPSETTTRKKPASKPNEPADDADDEDQDAGDADDDADADDQDEEVDAAPDPQKSQPKTQSKATKPKTQSKSNPKTTKPKSAAGSVKKGRSRAQK